MATPDDPLAGNLAPFDADEVDALLRDAAVPPIDPATVHNDAAPGAISEDVHDPDPDDAYGDDNDNEGAPAEYEDADEGAPAAADEGAPMVGNAPDALAKIDDEVNDAVDDGNEVTEPGDEDTNDNPDGPRYNLRPRGEPRAHFNAAMDEPHDARSYYPPMQLV